MARANVYEQIIDNVKAEKKAWCKGNWQTMDGKTVSACLLGHVDRAVGTMYLKPNGKASFSKDKRKYERAEAIATRLAGLIDPGYDPSYDRHESSAHRASYRIDDVDRPDDLGDIRFDGRGGARNICTSFNDDTETKKSDVLQLLRKAAKAFPND